MSSQSAGIGSALPDQTGFSGYILTTDGVTASWEVSSASLPSQGGNSGKFLTTNGTAASWASVTADGVLPSQTGNNGKVLGTNGTTASWVDASGLALGNFGSTPAAKGADLTAGTLTLEPADGTHPGCVSTAAQAFAGLKTFGDAVIAAGDVPGSGVTAGSVVLGAYPGQSWGAIWLTKTSPSATNYCMFDVGDGLFVNWGGNTGLSLRQANSELIKLSASGGFDMTGLGNSGSIKLKDDLGATKTCTISGGVWVIS